MLITNDSRRLSVSRSDILSTLRRWSLSQASSSDDDDETPEETRERLQEEEKEWVFLDKLIRSEVQAKIIGLRKRQNRLSPIHQLPVEVLLLIFTLACPSVPDAVRISHTCAHFRRVAISLPEIWTNFDISDLPLPLSAVLTRSREQPLDVRIPGDIGLPPLKMLAPHIGRLRSLAIIDLQKGDLGEIMHNMAITADRLEELVLECKRFTILNEEDDDDAELFASDTPRLRTLVLESVPIPTSSFAAIGGLTRLIMGFGRDVGYRPSAAHFLEILRSCPLLEELCVHRKGPLMHEGEPLETVHLPNLRELFLQALPPTQTAFLQHLSLPETALLKIGVDIGTYTEISPLLQTLSSARHLHNLQEIGEISFVGGGPNNDKWAVQMWTPTGRIALALIFVFPKSLETNAKIFKDLAASFAPRQPRRFGFAFITAGLVPSEATCSATVQQLPSLTELAFSHCDVEHTLDVLRALQNSTSTLNPILPNLRLLSIHDSQISAMSLVTVVRERGRKHPDDIHTRLRKLKLALCPNIGTRAAKLLRDWVSLDWDGDREEQTGLVAGWMKRDEMWESGSNVAAWGSDSSTDEEVDLEQDL